MLLNPVKQKNTSSYNEIGKFTEVTAILKKYDLTYEYAKKQILNGVELYRLENKDNLYEFIISDYGQKLVLEYNSLRKEFETHADFELRDELLAMRAADQMYRNDNYRDNISKQDSIDKLHEKRLIEIFENIGYPTEKLVGLQTMDNPVDINLFMLHTEDSIRMNYFVPKMKEFIIKGSASPQVLASMIDQYYVYKKEPQIYGTYKAQEGGYAMMIDDLKKVDSNRVSIGLPPLQLKEKRDSIVHAKYGY